jgi:N-methyl-L-proline demethylase
MTADPLLAPFQLRHLTLRNRIFSSSHEPAYAENGMPTARYRLYHEEKARGGVAMTMTAGSAVVSADSPPAFGNLHAFDDAIVPWIRELTDGIHSHGAAAMIQLTHLGRRAGGWGQDDWFPVVGASPIREPAHRNIPKEAEDWDLERIMTDYADAAERMRAGGMDGIEIEASGHLLDQFWSPFTNNRKDEFGGSLENRMRFPLDVFRALRARVGHEFIIGVRISVDERVPDGVDMDTSLRIVLMLEREGLIDFVNLNRGHIYTDAALVEHIPIHGMASAPHLPYAGTFRGRLAEEAATTGRAPLAVFHASKIDDVATARHAIREGIVDLIGMTRAHLADPHIVRKIMSGREAEIRPCVGATYCLDRIYENGEALCIHNAATSREATMPHVIEPATTKRRVVIIGAGPAGLEAGRVAGERGHHVTVLEAMPRPGGQLVLAARNPRRRDLNGIIDWRLAEFERLGVELRLDTYADRSTVLDLTPDVVIVATGGQPQLPEFEIGSELVSSSWEVMSGELAAQGSVLLYDDNGTHSAMSAAELLARREGVTLEIVTPERMLGIAVGGMNFVPYAAAFNETGTTITLNQRVLGVERNASRLAVTLGSDQSPHRVTRIVDHVVVDHGTAAFDVLYHDLRSDSVNAGAVDYRALRDGHPQAVVRNEQGRFQLFRIGDAVANRNVHAAIYDALRLCKDL